MTKPIFIVLLLILPTLVLLSSPSAAGVSVDLKGLLASPVDLTVYSPDRKVVIGHARYTITEIGENLEIIGNTRYVDGERDWEHVMLRQDTLNPLPVVKSFQANYLAADGSAQLVEKADFDSGQASCRWSGQLEDSSYENNVDFPPDTYAGSASLIPPEYALKRGKQSVRFHVFDCAPKPRVYTIDAKLEDGVAHWGSPNALVQMGLTPDLGWLNMVAKPFLFNISMWFNPREGYQYVGGARDRFYRGRSIVLVRHNGRPVARGGAEQGPSSDVVDGAK